MVTFGAAIGYSSGKKSSSLKTPPNKLISKSNDIVELNMNTRKPNKYKIIYKHLITENDIPITHITSTARVLWLLL